MVVARAALVAGLLLLLLLLKEDVALEVDEEVEGEREVISRP